MINTVIVHLVENYGYMAFFLAFTLGPFGVPVPNEVTIMTGAVLSSTGMLNPYMTYMCMLLGLVTAITISYIAGKCFGQYLHARLQQKPYVHKAEKLFERLGNKALCIGFFIPVLRYVLPLFAGIHGMTYRMFVILAYSSALLWTGLFFIIGHYAGAFLF
ncbi:DedA family protein [Paenibacillus wenxiniae]|uniref:DedA family protein n=1 Tax=Paenibacillus wenxiniae TaxID=1636843 RepID=A0ABW4RQA6_9BACL